MMREKILNKKLRWRFGLKVLSLFFCAMGAPAESLAVMTWQPAVHKHKAGMNHNRRAAKTFQLTEHADARVFLWQPDLKSSTLELDNDRLSLRPTGMDNYHALVAKKRSDNVTEVAIRYPFMRGKPSGISPRILTGAVKAGFEIVPAPLPREHRRYHAAHDAVFMLRYEGEPLSSTAVTLTTSNGTTLHATSDRNGALRFTLPDDFAETKPGRRNNKPAEFVLHSEYSTKGRSYRTSLSAPYHVDPAHWQSFELGLAVMAFGFVSGVAIIRRDRKRAVANQGRNS